MLSASLNKTFPSFLVVWVGCLYYMLFFVDVAVCLFVDFGGGGIIIIIIT